MIKICHLTSVHNINDVRILKKECVSLAANGFDVTLIACGNTSFEDIKYGVKRISLQIPVKNRLHRFLKRPRQIYHRALKVNAEIYHFHDPELLPIGLKLKKKGKKVIFDSHEFYGEQIREKKYIPSIFRNIIAILYIYYEGFICRKIDYVIQICTIEGKNYFENRSKKNICITNASVLDSTTLKNEKNFNKREYVAYIGALSYNRGITHLIKAAAKAKIKLVLSGQFVSEEYRKEVTQMPEFENVEYTGFLSYDKVLSILNNSLAGISTLLHLSQYDKIDTFSSKIYDYMAAGIPVIVSDTNYAKEMIKKYKFGICVDPNDIEAISTAITYLNENPDLANEMGENARKAFETNFNWKIEEKKLIALYNKIALTNPIEPNQKASV